MSFDKRKEFVEEGDTIVLFLGRQNLISLEVDLSKTHQTKFGAFPHRKFIGRKYGTKVYSNKGKGWLYVLHPDPESWTVTLPHRTQILYSTDISLITFELELKPGSIVVESGTGSGSLSHAIIRTIKPDGHLFTFDFHENRVSKVREEFDKHCIGSYVTTTCADVCTDGFSMTDKADAVFLDLPAPWDAVPYAKNTLKKTGGRICSFSPCIEQVQRTCDALRKSQFCEIQTMECLVRSMNVNTIPIPEMIFDHHIKSDLTEKVEAKKIKIDPELQKNEVSANKDATLEEVNKNVDVDIISNVNVDTTSNVNIDTTSNENIDTTSNEDADTTSNVNKDATLEEVNKNVDVDTIPNVNVDTTSNVNVDTTSNVDADTTSNVDACLDKVVSNSVEEKPKEESVLNSVTEVACSNGDNITGLNSYNMVTKLIAKPKKGNINVLSSKPRKEMAGHTGYLTFASLFPFNIDGDM